MKPYVFRAKSGLIEVNGINFNIDIELDASMSNMYFGCYETELTNLLYRFLRKGDTFIDIGANVGYISTYALGLVGRDGNVHAFEPVPQYLSRLRKIQEDNPGYSLHVNGVAVGEREGTANIAVTNLRNIGWNTMVPEFMSKDTIKEEIEISVIRLTDYLSDRDVQNLRLVKIDTEGFEFPVMKGFQEYLRKMKELPILIIEIAPSAYPRLNSTCGEFERFMSELGYVSRSIDCVNDVQIDKLDRTTDVVFIPRNSAQRIAPTDGRSARN
jgi:FkbM family methyltransferase